MAKTYIELINEFYDRAVNPDLQTTSEINSSVRAILSDVVTGEARAFYISDAQKQLLKRGVGATLLQWSEEGPGNIHVELEKFVLCMQKACDYVPTIDPEYLTIDITPDGHTGGILLNRDEELTLIDSLSFLHSRTFTEDQNILNEIVSEISRNSKTVLRSKG